MIQSEIQDELIMALSKDERMRKILELVRDYPGASLNKIVDLAKSFAAKQTVIDKLRELEEKKLIEKKAGERRGQKHEYYITELGEDVLSRVERIPPGEEIVKITFTESFFRKIKEAEKKQISATLSDPEKRIELGKLLGGLLVTYCKHLSKEPSYTTAFSRDGRLFYAGSFPRDWSELIRKMISSGLFRDDIEALKFLFNFGYNALEQLWREFKKGKEGVTIVFYGFKLNEGGRIQLVNEETIEEKLMEHFIKRFKGYSDS